MLLYTLLIILTILLILILIIRKDLFCPSSILCLSYIVATICAIYNVPIWKYKMHLNSIILIIVGVVTFSISSFMFNVSHRKKKKEFYTEKNISEIIIKRENLFVFNFLSFIIFIIYFYYFIKGIGGLDSFSNLSYVMRKYRFDLLEGEADFIPTIVNLFSKYCRALAFVSGYILINNILYYKKLKQKKKNIIPYIISIIIFVPFPLMTGSRFDLISYLIYLIMVWYIIMKRTSNFKINIAKFIKLFILTLCIIFIFSFTRTLVGRDDKSDTISYISKYFGGSIVMFDMYMQEDHNSDQYFAQEIFSSGRKFLAQIHLINEASKNVDTGYYRTAPNGIIIGNVYTAYRKMYNDFGFYGVIFFQIIMSIIFNKMYYLVLYKKENSKINTRIIIYSSIVFCLVFHSYSETFFSTVISFNYLILFIFILLISSIIQKLNLSGRRSI